MMDDAEICRRLDGIIGHLEHLEREAPLSAVFVKDQMKAAAESWWKRLVDEEFGGAEPGWARKQETP
jgi:hypothetical protein